MRNAWKEEEEKIQTCDKKAKKLVDKSPPPPTSWDKPIYACRNKIEERSRNAIVLVGGCFVKYYTEKGMRIHLYLTRPTRRGSRFRLRMKSSRSFTSRDRIIMPCVVRYARGSQPSS
jgi:hypothetical protein